jgi:hypothetical protein
VLCLLLAVPAGAGQAEKAVNPYTGNLFVDGDIRFTPAAEAGKPPQVYLHTPRYWKVAGGGKEVQGNEIPFDTQVKLKGDASIRLDGAGGKVAFSRSGWADTRDAMRHGWAYRAGVWLKLKDVKGKAYVRVMYSWGEVRSKDLAGTLDWTEVPVEFTCDRNNNLLNALEVALEGSGTVWIGGLDLRMKDPEAFRWWESWNGAPLTARLSQADSADEKSGVLPLSPPADELDAYGGIRAVTAQATGFFRTEKIGGKWWLITPEGHGFFKAAMFTPEFPTYRRAEEVMTKAGGREAWVVQTFLRLKSWGFNAIEWGPGYVLETLKFVKSPPAAAKAKMPYTANLRFELATDPARNGGIRVPVVDWGWQRFPDVFAKEFEEAVAAYGTPKQKGSHFNINTEDPWLIGYLLADGPPWYGPQVWYGSLAEGFHGLPGDAPGKKRWMEFLRKRYPAIADLNKAWESAFASWDEFAAAKVLPRNARSVEDRREFMGVIAERWYALVAAQVRKHDAKHLVLGGNATRLYPAVYAAEARNVDVLCASLYMLAGVYRPSPDLRYFINEQVHAWTGKPIMIGFFLGTRDEGGLPGIACVDGSKQRGQTYRSFMQQAASNEACVGTFWWMYQSWPEPNSEGYTKSWGLVRDDNRAYLDTLPYVQQANANVYRYRLAKAPAELEPPTLWAPSEGWLILGEAVALRLAPPPYPVDRCEIELAPAAQPDKARAIAAKPDKGFAAAEEKLAPGRYQWRARSVAGDKRSEWSLPFTFEVAAAEEVAAFKTLGEAIADGRNWKSDILQDGGQSARIDIAADSGGKPPISVAVERGKVARRITLTCKPARGLALRKGVPYSLRARLLADTEAAAEPQLTVGLKYGYRVTEDYAPIDKGWLVQQALSGAKPTHVRTTLRPARDMTVEELALRLDNCRGNVRVLALEFLPETEYEAGTTLMDDYKAIVNEYRSTQPREAGR